MSKQRCDHKGCPNIGGLKIKVHQPRNTLGKQHMCCGKCCPHIKDGA